jgi:hypothetical protein
MTYALGFAIIKYRMGFIPFEGASEFQSLASSL